MPEPLAYFQGRFLPAAEAAIPFTDAGFVQGVTVAEQMRTFGGELFRLEQHLERLARSLEIVGIDPGLPLPQLGDVARDLARRNHALLDPADDLGLSLFVTPGTYGTFAAAGASGPAVGMHTYPLPFGSWAAKYEQGESLWVSAVRQVPAACWPPELKCRSRMHYYLADQEARRQESGARALLLDLEGFVMEASTANVVACFAGEGLVSPPRDKILPGVSMAELVELAAGEGLPFHFRYLLPEELAAADEVLLCSTSPCVWPVTRLNGQPIGGGGPGPIARRLLAAWSERVGVPIAAQATRFAHR